MLSASIQKIRIDLVRVVSAKGAREGTVEPNVFRPRISLSALNYSWQNQCGASGPGAQDRGTEFSLTMPVGVGFRGRYYITLNQSSSRLKEYNLDYRRQKWLFLGVSDS